MGGPLRQTHLGPTADKILAIIDTKVLRIETIPGQIEEVTIPGYSKWVPTGEAFIFRLPDELLVSIVELATLTGSPWRGCSRCEPSWNAKSAKSLSQVCHRIRRMAQPLLFRVISFGNPHQMVAPTTPVIKLHRVLQRTPSLRQHCRCLSIHISDILAARSPHHFDIVNDFARWLTRVRCLSVHGGFEEKFNNPHTWALIRNLVVNMREVEHATISREWFGLYLGPIMRNIEFPKLRELNIHGISHSKKEITILDPKKHRTASFTALSISDYEESPGSTALLIQWPTTLVHFEFGSFYNNPHIMDLPMFQSWLFIHRETLKNINIGYLSRAGSKRLFDATFFPNLESLQLSRWQMERPLQFTAEDANVLGPKVKLFGWDFSIYDQHNEGWDDFGENEESWISELGKAAVARQSSLKTIAIYFGPDHWGAGKKESYPWDRMDSVRDGIMRPNGMDLVYNRPCISREEWLAERRGGTKAESISLSDLNMQEAPESASADESESESDTLVMAEPGFYGRDIRWYFAPVQRPWNISELRG